MKLYSLINNHSFLIYSALINNSNTKNNYTKSSYVRERESSFITISKRVAATSQSLNYANNIEGLRCNVVTPRCYDMDMEL